MCGEEVKPAAEELALGPEQVKPLSVGVSGGGAHQEPVGIPGVEGSIGIVTVKRFSLLTFPSPRSTLGPPPGDSCWPVQAGWVH